MTQLATPPIETQAQRNRRDALALLAIITPADTFRIAENWNRLAPRPYRGLASAGTSSPTIAPAGRFWFDPDTIRFAHGTRGFIPQTAIRSALNAFNANAAAEMGTVAASAARGEIGVDVWENTMMRQIKDAQLVNAAIGRGGASALEQGDLYEVGQGLAYQYGRLDRFAGQVDADIAGEPEAVRARAGHYAESAISTFGRMRGRAAEVAGFTMEINRLGNAEHCPECPELSKLGWVSIGALPPIGMRQCVWNCRCAIDYRSGE